MHAWISFRFTMRGTDRGRFSPLTFFAWLAIGLGIGAMTGLISVMYGFESTLKARVLAASPHVLVKARENDNIINPKHWESKIAMISGLSRSVPFIETEMIASSDTKTLGVVVWGLPAVEMERFRSGLKFGVMPNYDSKYPEALVANELGNRLDVDPGSLIELVSPVQFHGTLGMIPVKGSFKIKGVYSSGHYEFDQQHLFIFLEDAQELLGMKEAIHGWQLWGKSVDDARKIAEVARLTLGESFDVQSWEDFNSALFQSLKLEQFAMFSILSLAVLVAVLNVGITLAMHVTYKRRNIGILKALGASNSVIQKIFRWQGFWLGFIGLCLGTVLTCGLFAYIRFYSAYQLPDIYYDRSLPIEVRLVPTLLIYVVCALCVWFATMCPSRSAALLDPIAAIRE